MYWLKLEKYSFSTFFELEHWDENVDGIMQIRAYVSDYEDIRGYQPDKIIVSHDLFCLLDRQTATKAYLSACFSGSGSQYKILDNLNKLTKRLCLPKIETAPALNAFLDVGSIIKHDEKGCGVITHIYNDIDLKTRQPFQVHMVRFKKTSYSEGSLGEPALLKTT